MSDAVEVNIAYPNGDGSSRLMIRNDRTGTSTRGNYDVAFFQTAPTGAELEISRWRIEGYQRWFGIELLVSTALEQLAAAANAEDSPAKVPDTVHGGYVEPDAVPPTKQERIESLRNLIGRCEQMIDALESEAAAPAPQ